MAASSEIRFKIGGDTSALSRAFVQAESIAAAAGKQLNKKLGMEDAFKSAVLAIGLSIDKIAEKVGEIFSGGSLASWQSALSAAEQAARTLEESMFNRLNLARQIEAIEGRMAQNRVNEDATPREADFTRGWRRLFNSPSGRENLRRLGFGGETDADATTRSETARATRLADEARLTALKEKQIRNEQRLADARRELDATGLEGWDKFNAAMVEVDVVGKRLEDARKRGADTAELELQLINKQKAAKQIMTDNVRRAAEEEKRTAEETARKQKEAAEKRLELVKREAEARRGVDEATRSRATARADALAFTVGEAASGQRGNSADRANAQAILRDEARARRLFDTGGTVTEFDSETQRNEVRDAKFFQRRAEARRLLSGRLQSQEQNPFAGVDKQLQEANELLAEIRDQLVPTAPKP